MSPQKCSFILNVLTYRFLLWLLFVLNYTLQLDFNSQQKKKKNPESSPVLVFCQDLSPSFSFGRTI